MLEFINNNGVLFSGLFSVFTALIAAIVALIIDSRKSKRDSVKSLKTEIAELKENLLKTQKELSQYKNIEELEKNIDKSVGTIYKENMKDGSTRNICGYCWEKEHLKIPLIKETYNGGFGGISYQYYKCRNCNAKHYTK